MFGFDASGDKWRKELTSFMNDWFKTISFIEKRQDVGMVAGTNVILDSSDDQEIYAQKEALKIAEDILKSHISEYYLFVAGTMFLARACLFKKIQNKFLLSDFESANKQGNTLAHIFERIFGIICYMSGYRVVDVGENYLWCRKINFLKYVFNQIIRFVYQKKVSRSGYLTIKFLKFPIYRKRLSVKDNEI